MALRISRSMAFASSTSCAARRAPRAAPPRERRARRVLVRACLLSACACRAAQHDLRSAAVEKARAEGLRLVELANALAVLGEELERLDRVGALELLCVTPREVTRVTRGGMRVIPGLAVQARELLQRDPLAIVV